MDDAGSLKNRPVSCLPTSIPVAAIAGFARVAIVVVVTASRIRLFSSNILISSVIVEKMSNVARSMQPECSFQQIGLYVLFQMF